MPSSKNQKRTLPSLTKPNIWQRISGTSSQKNLSSTLYEDLNEDIGEEEPPPPLSPFALIRRLASVLAIILFTGTLASISYLALLTWLPNDDIKPITLDERAPSLDIGKRIAHAGAGVITFTENELNQILAQSCQMGQEGSFSIFSRPENLSIRLYDGYAQITITRLIGSDFYHHTSANIHFYRQGEESTDKNQEHSIAYKLQGGEPIFAGIPRGGQIGQLPIPERLVTSLIPPLKRLAALYPDLQTLVEERGYLPTFTKDSKGQRIVQLSPPPLIEFEQN